MISSLVEATIEQSLSLIECLCKGDGLARLECADVWLSKSHVREGRQSEAEEQLVECKYCGDAAISTEPEEPRTSERTFSAISVMTNDFDERLEIMVDCLRDDTADEPSSSTFGSFLKERLELTGSSCR